MRDQRLPGCCGSCSLSAGPSPSCLGRDLWGDAGEEKPSHEKLLKTAVEGTVRMFLQLLDHLVNAEQLLSSPQAATLLLTPIPGSKAAPEQTSAEELVRVIQVSSHPGFRV